MPDEITAEELSKKLKSISVAEFFEKNRHLLGFDSKRKALLTCVKECVDNSLDATEDISVLPEINVWVKDKGEGRYKITVEDNGSGIVKEKIPDAFGSLLYGSKFHTLKQQRGQQGIGVSASVLYGQLTIGTPAVIISRISEKKPAYLYQIMIDVARNQPDILKEESVNDFKQLHGTRVEIEMEGEYLSKGTQSIYEYLKRTSIINPHAKIVFYAPDKQKFVFKRTTNKLPKPAKEIKPHPHGLELGILQRLLQKTTAKSLLSFLTKELSRVGATTAKEICKLAKLNLSEKPQKLDTENVRRLLKAMQSLKLMRPPLDCLSPIGTTELEKSIEQELKPEFVYVITRPTSVYRGLPFLVQAAVAYGGEIKSFSALRFANKVPLSFQKSSCVITQAISEMDWRRYGLSQPSGKGAPEGPLAVLVHVGSVWVPFASEGKQAVASYPIIKKEIKLALMECARQLQSYLRRRYKEKRGKERLNLFLKYAPEVSNALSGLTGEDKEKIHTLIKKMVKGEEKNEDKGEAD